MSEVTVVCADGKKYTGNLTEAKEPTNKPPLLSIGSQVFIRTVTNFYVGEVVKTELGMIFLTKASWVADTGRFHVALRDGILNEVEPYPEEVIVFMAACVDVCRWNHPLPTTAK